MTITKTARRICSAAGLALTAAVASACSDARSPISPAAAPASQSALQGDPSLGSDIAAVRAATAQFHDVDVAIAAGYVTPVGRLCDQIDLGTMGIHSPNPAFIGSQTLDPLHPEVLLYVPKPGGGFRLIGVEYIQPVLLRNPATNQVAPWTSHDPWPTNYQVVTPTPALFGHTFQGPMPGHIPGMPWHWDLHAYIWVDNPNGMFEQWNPNPSIGCSHAD